MDATFHHDSITLTDPGDLIALVPHLLGFHPTESLVVVNLNGKDGSMVCSVIRADLPSPDNEHDLITQFAIMLMNNKARQAVLIVVTENDPADERHRDLLARCASRLKEFQISADHWFRTSGTAGGSTWCRYDNPDAGGTVPDSIDDKLTVELPIQPSRDDVVAMLAPVDDDTLARRAQLLAACTAHDRMGEQLPIVEAAIERAAAGTLPVSDDEIATLANALSDHAVRDVCFVQPDDVHVRAAERLWIALVRGTPAPERAEPASMLAFSAYQRGDGVLAGIALEIASAADPDHRLTNLLVTSMTIAVAPSRLQKAAQQAAAYAQKDIDGTQQQGQP